MNKKCIGCGIKLQTNNKDLPGYVKEDKYNEAKYCERCFKLIHYNEYKQVDIKNINNILIDRINKEKHLTFFLIDLLNLSTETINYYKKIEADKVLVISKKDIIPKSIKEEKIIKFIKDTYDINEDILLISALKGNNISKIVTKTISSNTNTIYIAGYTNSGKSTLINYLCEKNNIKPVITTSSIPNTTLDFLSLTIDGITIIDTPGFILSNTIYDNTDYKLIKRINPKKYLKPLTYQTKDITGFQIEDKMYLTTSNTNSLTFYISNDIKVDKVYKNKLNNLNKINLSIDDNTDLIIKGLGFVNIKKKSNITIYCNKDNIFEVRKSIFTKE